MGVLRIIGIPFRRLLHDSTFAVALTSGDSYKTTSDFMGLLMSHAPGAIFVLLYSIVILIIGMFAFLAAVALVIVPIRAIREWQKTKVLADGEGQKRYRYTFIMILGIILAITADSTWSNVVAYSMSQATDRATNLVTAVDRHLVLLEKSASEAQRFVTGMDGVFARAATGDKDLRPMLKDVDELLGEGRIFLEYVQVQGLALERLVADAHLENNPMVSDLVGNISNALEAKDVVALIEPFTSRLKTFVNTGDSKEGLAAFKLALNSLEHVRLAISQVKPLMQTIELARFLGVFLLLLLLIATAAASFQFYRMRRFRILSILMCVACLILCWVEVLFMWHLILGTTLGALCDGIYGAGGQEPVVFYNQTGLPPITGPHLHAFTSSCEAGADIPGALMAAFTNDSKDKGKLINLMDIVTLDPMHREVIINVGPVVMTVPLEGHRGDLKKATELVVDKAMKEAGPAILEYARKIANNMDQIKDRVTSFDIGNLLIKLDNLKAIIGGLETPPELPAEMTKVIKEIKIEFTKKIDRIVALLKRIQSKQDQISQIVTRVSAYVDEAAKNPDVFLQQLQQDMKVTMHPFVADVLQPAFECQEVGHEVQALLSTLCIPGSAMQGLIAALWLLLGTTVVVILLQIAGRKFSEERVATNVNPT